MPKIKEIILIFLCIAVILATGCMSTDSTKTPQTRQGEPIIGTWAYYATKSLVAIYTFNDDGSGSVLFSDNNQVENLTWRTDTRNVYICTYQNPAILNGQKGYLFYENNAGETLKDLQGNEMKRYTP